MNNQLMLYEEEAVMSLLIRFTSSSWGAVLGISAVSATFLEIFPTISLWLGMGIDHIGI